jgi:hypothetical protein
MGHLVVGAAQLEGENGKQIFSLEQDLAFESIAEIDGVSQGSLRYDIVDLCGRDESNILRHRLDMVLCSWPSSVGSEPRIEQRSRARPETCHVY